MPRSHRCPAEVQHQQFESFGRFGCSPKWREINCFEDSVRGYALHAIVTYLASDIPEKDGPRVRWCHGLASGSEALDKAHGRGCFSLVERGQASQTAHKIGGHFGTET
jgi:hypothetical protein